MILARKQLEIEREMACDDRVIDRGTKAEIYVESILKVAGRGVLYRGMHQLGMISSKKILEKRIGMIMNEARARYVSNYRWKLALSVAMISLVIWTMTPAHSESPGSDRSILGRRTSRVYQAGFEAKLTAEQGEQLKQASAELAKPYIDSIAITRNGEVPIKTDSTAWGSVKNAFPLSSRLVIRSKEFESSTTIILTEEQRHSALKGAKIENFRLHDLRHTAGTRLAEAGADAFTIKDINRHKREPPLLGAGSRTTRRRRGAGHAYAEVSSIVFTID